MSRLYEGSMSAKVLPKYKSKNTQDSTTIAMMTSPVMMHFKTNTKVLKIDPFYEGPIQPTSGNIEGKIPCARDGHVAALLGERIFIFGGDRHTNSFNDLFYFDASGL